MACTEVDRRHAVYLTKHLEPPPQQAGCNTGTRLESVFEGSYFYLPESVLLDTDKRYINEAIATMQTYYTM